MLPAARPQTAESQDFKRDQAREQPPEEMFDKLWMEEHLKRCLMLVRNEVEEATFTAFRLYVIEERPVEEVCKDLNMTTNQLYKVKWRLIQKLGEKMKELMADAE